MRLRVATLPMQIFAPPWLLPPISPRGFGEIHPRRAFHPTMHLLGLHNVEWLRKLGVGFQSGIGTKDGSCRGAPPQVFAWICRENSNSLALRSWEPRPSSLKLSRPQAIKLPVEALDVVTMSFRTLVLATVCVAGCAALMAPSVSISGEIKTPFIMSSCMCCFPDQKAVCQSLHMWTIIPRWHGKSYT